LISLKCGSGTRAFTLIEILLVLALIGVMVGLVAGNTGALIGGSKTEPPGRVLKQAVVDCLYLSCENKRVAYLSYHEENATFLISNASGGVMASHGIFEGAKEETKRDKDDNPKVTFRSIGPLAGPAGGSSVFDEDILIVKRVPFHFGASVPFEAEIEVKGQSDNEIYEFDPFSGYHLKKLKKE
jgi:prepilin-type N-terminal cleavage/methylation domain-containing protein